MHGTVHNWPIVALRRRENSLLQRMVKAMQLCTYTRTIESISIWKQSQNLDFRQFRKPNQDMSGKKRRMYGHPNGEICFSLRNHYDFQLNPPLFSPRRTVELIVPSFKRVRSNTDSPNMLWSVPTHLLMPGERPTELISTIWSSVTISTKNCSSMPMTLASFLQHQGWMRWTNAEHL